MKGEKEIPGRNRLRKDRNVCEKLFLFWSAPQRDVKGKRKQVLRIGQREQSILKPANGKGIPRGYE
jgi:hypothetical protein